MSVRRRLCAICDSTNETTRICDKCKRDPANVDWREQPWWEVSVDDVVAVSDAHQASGRASYTPRKRYAEDGQTTDLERAIIIALMKTTKSNKEIAEALRCSERLVRAKAAKYSIKSCCRASSELAEHINIKKSAR